MLGRLNRFLLKADRGERRDMRNLIRYQGWGQSPKDTLTRERT